MNDKELIQLLYNCLDDEVRFCNRNGLEPSAKSIKALQICQEMGFGGSVALIDLDRKDKRERDD